MKIKLWGVRGSLPVPGPDTVRYGGNTSCVEVRAGGEIFVFDGGSGLRGLGGALMQEQAESGGNPLVCHMLFGHAHWDHIQGFPFFVPAYAAGNIIHLYTAEGQERRLDEALAGQQEFTYFPVTFEDLSATFVHHDIGSDPIRVGDVVVRHTGLNHPGGCLGYRLEEGGRTLVYLCDHEPYAKMLEAPTVRLRLVEEGVSLDSALEGARQDDERIAEFARRADVMVADAAYTNEEYELKVGWGHSSVDDVVQMALKAQVSTVVLTHHDMAHSDDVLDSVQDYVDDLLGHGQADLECVVAREGFEINL